MILIIIFFMLSVVYADPTWKWTNAIEVVDKHEFYKNDQIIDRPKDVWQLLFAVVYHDSNLQTLKDCVFYKVPGTELGILKIKTIHHDKTCEEMLYRPGDFELGQLKALQFKQQENFLSIIITDQEFKVIRWDTPLLNNFIRPAPKILMSSAEYRAGRILFLKPNHGEMAHKQLKAISVKDIKQCHEINEDCSEKTSSSCTQCPYGWYEIPNGCPQGPKFCGSITCGTKGAPACRRGIEWQRVKKRFRCREDSSFAYCAKGLSIQCEGDLAYCL
jgi:hypothetical protein